MDKLLRLPDNAICIIGFGDKAMNVISKENKTVVVGMSGGVDSSVCAYLLKEQGYNVVGATMQIWQECDNHENSSFTSVDDAKRVADMLGIPHYTMDFRKEFKERVVNDFIQEYLAGRTPNPCIVCNRYMKWESLLKRSMEIGADYIATGHYARIEKLDNGRYAIRNSITATKDQTYALYKLTQEQLEHTLMPVGDYAKEEVRKIAKEIGLTVADKPDSMDICFVTDNDYAGFIERNAGKKIETGNFVDIHGNVLGTHKGITCYTVGQRKGLGLSLGHPVFVTEIRPETNEVVIGENEDIFVDTVIANKVNFMGEAAINEDKTYIAKIRYNHKGSPCHARLVDDKLVVTFDAPVRAVTPGQALVVYSNDYVAFGGTILKGANFNG